MRSGSTDQRIKNKARACMIEYGDSVVCIDPSLKILDLLGKKYTMMIIGVLGNRLEKKNFNEILNDIPFSSTTIISRRLKELQSNGLIEKILVKNKTSYKLTKFGWAIRSAMEPLLRVMDSGS